MCYGFSNYPVAGYGYQGYPVAGAGYGSRNNFALIVVLFILLIIVGASRFNHNC